MRKKNQVLLKSAPGNTGGQDGAGGYRHGKGYGQVGGGRKSFDLVPTTAVKYDPTQRDVKCRICVTLEGEGETDGIYDDHYHSVASGCPKFAAMPRDTKLKYVTKAELCPDCSIQTSRGKVAHPMLTVQLDKRTSPKKVTPQLVNLSTRRKLEIILITPALERAILSILKPSLERRRKRINLKLLAPVAV